MELLGLDIGTSGCKATIVDFEGNIKGQAYQEYSLLAPNPGWEELDPNQVWRAVKEVIAQCLSQRKGAEIQALSVSSFGEAVIPIDRKGNSLHNSMIYIDCRGRDEAIYLKSRLGYEAILHLTGVAVHPMYSINKIMWLRKHRPEIYHNTWKFLCFADFILFKLGAKPATDYSLAARTMAFDIIQKRWSPEILECAGIDEDKFGEPVQAGTVVGRIAKGVAAELGLSKETLLVAGGHDQSCAALGAGVVANGMAVDGIGTTECITPTFARPIISAAMAENNFACVPHVKKDMYVTYAFTFTSGSVLKWYRDNFSHPYQAQAAKAGVNIYDFLIEQATKGPTELFLLPHFAGAATPYMDTQAKGAILGLSIHTKAPDIIKAILEGINYEMMINLDRLQNAGVRIEEIRAVGGLAKSERFLQLKADMFGKKVSTLQVSEAGTLGVAILAGTASGVYQNIEDGIEKLIKKKKDFYPNGKLHEIYRERFEKYQKIYPALQEIYASF